MIQRHDFLIIVDSDGCAFDTMEIKHQECFIPHTIRCWRLQPISRYVRRLAEFVNLRSRFRGLNRFPALIKLFDWLQQWPDLQTAQRYIPPIPALRRWVAQSNVWNHKALAREIENNDAADLRQALEWSQAINRSVRAMVRGIPPFAGVAESLALVSDWADILVCSVTDQAQLVREWQEHGLDRYLALIAGQKSGSKAEIVRLAMQGRYQRDKVLMIGDAPSDQAAADENGVAFYPILAGREAASWGYFYQEAAELFHTGRYRSHCEPEWIADFYGNLPLYPDWQRL
ncbi:HAD family hydrolase [bacterium]|nr:HAD family hydrolase [bacterium]